LDNADHEQGDHFVEDQGGRFGSSGAFRGLS
jgi:hypothetical protein